MPDRAWAVLAFLTVGSTALSGQGTREHLPGWNASFGIPAGWRLAQRSGRAAALTDTMETAVVFLAATFLSTPGDAATELRALFADLHYKADTGGAPADTTISGRRAQVGHYRGAGLAGPVVAHSAVVFTAHGTGVTVLGVSTAEHAAAVAAVVLRVAASIDAAAPVTNGAWVANLTGRWKYIPPPAARDSNAAGSAVIDEWLEFAGRERFTWRSRTVVRLPGTGPFVSEGDNDGGTYTVVGSTLVLRGGSGSRALDIQLTGDRLSVAGRLFQRTPQ